MVLRRCVTTSQSHCVVNFLKRFDSLKSSLCASVFVAAARLFIPAMLALWHRRARLSIQVC